MSDLEMQSPPTRKKQQKEKLIVGEFYKVRIRIPGGPRGLPAVNLVVIRRLIDIKTGGIVVMEKKGHRPDLSVLDPSYSYRLANGQIKWTPAPVWENI